MDRSRLPLIEELPAWLSPFQAFERFYRERHAIFLDSGMDPYRLGRFSFIGVDPFLVMKSRGRDVRIITGQGEQKLDGNPFDILGGLLEKYSLDSFASRVPFAGGAAGYLAYDLCHFIERLPTSAVDDLHLPESYLGFYDVLLAFDNLEKRCYVISTGFPELDRVRRLKRAHVRLEEMEHKLSCTYAIRRSEDGRMEMGEGRELIIKSNFTPEGYVEAVQRVREYIAAGDVFQVNLSQRFEAELNVPPFELYCRLREINPAPFASYLNFEEVTVVSASPERFLKVSGDWVETRPIKGTRPRGKTPEDDERLAKELLGSIKDRAENVMIVDLERNDLGKVCRYGTVKVTELAILETFPTVFHLTSTVVGRLRPDKTRIDLLKASFPGGSITGAPKVRAMEIIDELEPTRRSVYTGCIGYFSFDGNMDLNIVIRTILIKGGRAYFQVGGGIVYDSEPEAEYQETLDKAKALVQALRLAPRVAVES
jgi:para-aminobenzoate synthetase component 1